MRYCQKCRGTLCSCGFEYSTSNQAGGTDDKKPREWLISDDGRSFEILDGLGIIIEYKGAPPKNPVSVIEKSAYDSLSERLKAAEAELEAYKKAKAENDERFQLEAGRERERAEMAEAEIEMLKGKLVKYVLEDTEEVSQLKAELLNTKELSSKLVEENAALKAEVERLNIECISRFLHETRINELQREFDRVFNAYQAEREINKVLREALETVVLQFEDMQDSEDISEHWHKLAREALAREKEMRTGDESN